MPTTIGRPSQPAQRDVHERPTSVALTKALLGFGVLYSAAYVIANDVFAALIYDGYDRLDQAVSELSATGAPSKAFLRAMLPVFTILMFGFATGVWRAARGSVALRITSGVLFASAAVSIAWLWFPMTSRSAMGEGPMPGNDVGHIALTVVTIALIVAQMGFGSAPLAKWFRSYSLVSVMAVVGFGALTAVLAPNIATGDATPWMGLYERLSMGAWLLWMAVFAMVLMRTHAGDAPPAA